MSEASPFAAQLMRSSIDGFAGLAASRLLESHPDLADRYGSGSFDLWREQFRAQVDHLATAVADGIPESFARHLTWSKIAFDAREVPAEDLRAAVLTLQGVLEGDLPPAAWEPVAPHLSEALDTLAGVMGGNEALDTQEPDGQLASDIVADLLAGEAARARARIATTLQEGRTTESILFGVIVPALHEIGHRWHVGKIGVAEEHFATGVLRQQVGRLIEDAACAQANGKTVLVGAVAGDAHDLALQLVSGMFELDGWRAINLGADVPPSEMALASQHFNADLVVISATMEVQRANCSETVAAIRATSPDIPILVGGAAFDVASDSWKLSGADSYSADPKQAVLEGRRLTNLDG